MNHLLTWTLCQTLGACVCTCGCEDGHGQGSPLTQLRYICPLSCLGVRSKGLTAFNGLGMLLFQAAEAFETWTGETMPTAEIWSALEEKYNTK